MQGGAQMNTTHVYRKAVHMCTGEQYTRVKETSKHLYRWTVHTCTGEQCQAQTNKTEADLPPGHLLPCNKSIQNMIILLQEN